MKAASRTDTGKIRTNNEDSILADKEHGIFILADGMGGHNAGEVASQLVVKEAHSFILNKLETVKDDAAILSVLEEAILYMTTYIIAHSLRNVSFGLAHVSI